jgi:thioredoxin 1
VAIVNLTAKDFEQTVTRTGIVLLDWWAAWCGPCRMFAPIYEQASGRHPDVVFGKIDTDAEQELAAAFDIRSIPTLMAFRDGVLVFSQAGVVPGPALDKLVAEVAKLDMEEVRRQIAEDEAKAGEPPKEH